MVTFEEMVEKYPEEAKMMNTALQKGISFFDVNNEKAKVQIAQLALVIAAAVDDKHSIIHRGGFSAYTTLQDSDYPLDARMIAHYALKNAGFAETAAGKETLSHIWGPPIDSAKQVSPERMEANLHRMLGDLSSQHNSMQGEQELAR